MEGGKTTVEEYEEAMDEISASLVNDEQRTLNDIEKKFKIYLKQTPAIHDTPYFFGNLKDYNRNAIDAIFDNPYGVRVTQRYGKIYLTMVSGPHALALHISNESFRKIHALDVEHQREVCITKEYVKWDKYTCGRVCRKELDGGISLFKRNGEVVFASEIAYTQTEKQAIILAAELLSEASTIRGVLVWSLSYNIKEFSSVLYFFSRYVAPDALKIANVEVAYKKNRLQFYKKECQKSTVKECKSIPELIRNLEMGCVLKCTFDEENYYQDWCFQIPGDLLAMDEEYVDFKISKERMQQLYDEYKLHYANLKETDLPEPKKWPPREPHEPHADFDGTPIVKKRKT